MYHNTIFDNKALFDKIILVKVVHTYAQQNTLYRLPLFIVLFSKLYWFIFPFRRFCSKNEPKSEKNEMQIGNEKRKQENTENFVV